MNRKSRFALGLAIAAITFGTLFATIGPRHFQHRQHCCGAQKCERPAEQKNTDVQPSENFQQH